MSYSIRDLSGIEPGVASKLKAVGIRTTEKLLDAAKNLKGRKALTEKIGVHEKEPKHDSEFISSACSWSARAPSAL